MLKHSIGIVLFMAIFLSTGNLFAQTTDDKGDGIVMNKGLRFTILTFSLSNRNAINDYGLLANYVDQKKYSWDVRADGGYIFKKNLGLGLGLSYGQSQDDNTSKSSDGALSYNRSHSNEYGIRPYIKNFIPLDRKNRFYVINQTELQFIFDHSVSETTINQILTRIYTTNQKYGIGLRPGLMIFVVRTFAFETTVDVFGISTSIEKSQTSGLPDSRITNTDVNFKIDILKLAFGFSYYF